MLHMTSSTENIDCLSFFFSSLPQGSVPGAPSQWCVVATIIKPSSAWIGHHRPPKPIFGVPFAYALGFTAFPFVCQRGSSRGFFPERWSRGFGSIQTYLLSWVSLSAPGNTPLRKKWVSFDAGLHILLGPLFLWRFFHLKLFTQIRDCPTLCSPHQAIHSVCHQEVN